MQRLYWGPTHVSRSVHVLMAVLSLVVLFAAERFQVSHVQPHLEEKQKAATRMAMGMDVLRTYRIRHVAEVDAEIDPTESGMLGTSASTTTTTSGSLEAKRTTVNPNWAAVLVDLLYDAGVEPGDLVALGVSGSFPALNLAAFAAAEELDLEIVSIASAGASSWGANFPNYSWLRMESVLGRAGVISNHSVAASLGGVRDRALGMSATGRGHLRAAIDDSEATFLSTETKEASIETRMDTYAAAAAGRRFSAYINAGGSLVSIGPRSAKRLYRPGLISRPHARGTQVDSVMMRFLRDGVPVINLSKVVPLAERYGLPVEPVEMPRAGEGTIFERREHSRLLVAVLLGGLIAALYGMLRLGLGAHITTLGGGSSRFERRI